MATSEMETVTLSEGAWRALDAITRKNGKKLLVENSDRNEDGTYSVEVETAFMARLRMVMMPGETVEQFIMRCARRLNQ
jgi:hypothetical protein